MVNEGRIQEAQRAWGEGIVKIGKVFLDKGDYTAAAKEHIDEFYNYQEGQVLFKPTLAAQRQFRLDFIISAAGLTTSVPKNVRSLQAHSHFVRANRFPVLTRKNFIFYPNLKSQALI